MTLVIHIIRDTMSVHQIKKITVHCGRVISWFFSKHWLSLQKRACQSKSHTIQNNQKPTMAKLLQETMTSMIVLLVDRVLSPVTKPIHLEVVVAWLRRELRTSAEMCKSSPDEVPTTLSLLFTSTASPGDSGGFMFDDEHEALICETGGEELTVIASEQVVCLLEVLYALATLDVGESVTLESVRQVFEGAIDNVLDAYSAFLIRLDECTDDDIGVNAYGGYVDFCAHGIASALVVVST